MPQVLAAVSHDDEVAESRRFARGFLLPIDDEPALVARGQATLALLEQAVPASLSCRVHVLEGGGAQAFGKGGENMYLSSDLIELPDDEAAAVIAHERVHLVERHLTQAFVFRALGESLAQRVPEPERASVTRVASLAQAAVQRDQEFEADAGGAHMLAAAGFDSGAMQRALTRLLPADGPVSPLDDHPPSRDRLARLEAHLV